MRWTRRTFCAALGASAVGSWSRVGHAAAGAVAVPESLQAKLLSKVAAFDRNMVSRAGGEVRVLVAQRSGQPESVRSSIRLKSSLGAVSSIAGMPVSVGAVDFASGSALAQSCRSGGISIVYLTPGLDDALEEVAYYLGGTSVLSVSTVADHVYSGSVLSFDLVEGKPKILVHLARAKAQYVDFKASFLKLAKVVDR